MFDRFVSIWEVFIIILLMFRTFTKDIINTWYLINTEGFRAPELTTDRREIFHSIIAYRFDLC